MATVEPYHPSMFDALHGAFLADDDPILRSGDWRRLLDADREPALGPAAYCLVDRDRPVGMLGTMFGRRLLDGVERRTCNVHSWFVEPAHRGRGLLLLRRVLRQADLTVTGFTSRPVAYTLSKRLGMQDLDGRLRILLPLSSAGDRVELIDDPAEIAMSVEPHDRAIVRDHELPWCRHTLVRADDGAPCLVVWSVVDRWAMPYAYAHHVSAPSVFAAHSAAIRMHVMAQAQTRFMAVDARRFPARRLPRSLTLPVAPRQLARPAGVPAEGIDTLYSEVSFLNLSTMPDIGAALRRAVVG